MSDEARFTTIRRETPADGVAWIVLNRPEKANAQNARLLHELDQALEAAARDEIRFFRALIHQNPSAIFLEHLGPIEKTFNPLKDLMEKVVWSRQLSSNETSFHHMMTKSKINHEV